MSRPAGFDNDAYLQEQTAAILERLEQFEQKLYLEFGGKLVFDYHASRVLPGFDPNAKMTLLQRLKNDAEIILCIYAGDIERRKLRADFGVTYDVDALRLIDDLRMAGIGVAGVVITRYEGQPSAKVFRNKLERRQIPVCTHRATRDYPADVDLVVSEEGYGANEYIETARPLVIVTGPGPGSGKLATCLSQMYHDHRAGRTSGYAKFETFPIWNLPLKHPVNVAYEAATADLKDVNLIDPFHLEAYGETAVNYNRDVEAFPLLKRILERITGAESPYRSPTDMGVNRAGFAITDDAAVRAASRQEVIRRHFRYRCEYALGVADRETVERVSLLMEELDVTPSDRRVVEPAKEAAEEARRKGKGHKGIFCGAALELRDGTIVSGKNSPLMHASSSLVLNAVKKLAGIPDDMHLLSPMVIESVGSLKQSIFNSRSASLDLEEALIALSISATMNPSAQRAMETLKDLQGCEAHLTHMPTPGDEAGLKSLGINLTSEPQFSSKSLFHR
ncbi:MAG: DUF1846 domain-containing protein [Candidatus Brocadiaceae bacterium]|jgi:uncharacterized protein (UPF0371 family)